MFKFKGGGRCGMCIDDRPLVAECGGRSNCFARLVGGVDKVRGDADLGAASAERSPPRGSMPRPFVTRVSRVPISGWAIKDLRMAAFCSRNLPWSNDGRCGGAGPMGSESGDFMSSCISATGRRCTLSELGVLATAVLLPRRDLLLAGVG